MSHVLTLSTCIHILSPPVSPFSQKHHLPNQSHRKQIHRKTINRSPGVTLSLTTAKFHFLTLNISVIVIFFLTFCRATFPYANFGVDGGIGPSGTFWNCKPEWKRQKKNRCQPLRNVFMQFIFHKEGQRLKQQCQWFLERQRNKRLPPRQDSVKFLLLGVCLCMSVF